MSISNFAAAAALGEATVRSALGQTLDADIAIASLSATESDSLLVRIAPASAFSDAGIDYTPLLRSLHVVIEKRGELRLVRVTSDLPVQDPFIRLLVELNAGSSRMIREYALLIDPPAITRPGADAGGEVPVAGRPPVMPAEADSRRSPAPAATVTPPAMPAPAPADTAATGAQDNGSRSARLPATRVVRRGDTLRSIGAELRPQDAQLEQVMVALQQANPNAFIRGNINRVRSGSVLRVPDAEAIQAVDPAAARRSLQVQAADFIRDQQRLAPPPPSPEAAPQATGNRSSRGQVGAAAEAPVASAPAQDKLTLSAPGTTERATGKASPADALDKLASDKALEEANSRIAALEKNISQLQQVLEIRNGALADAQQRAAQAVSPPASPTAPAHPSDKVIGATNPPATQDAAPAPQLPAVPAAPAADSPPEPPAATKRDPDPVAAKPAPPARNRPATTVSLQESMLGDPLARAAAAALLLLLLVWGALRWRRRHQAAGAPSVEPVLASQTVIAGAGGRHVDTRHSEFHSNFVPSVSQIDANEVDAVAEADVYIAYGRDEQAEEILLDALRAHPERHALHVKLLEIHAARKDRQKFGALAAELRVLTHGVGADWEKAALLGRQVDPDNHLFDTPGVQPVEASSPSSPVDDFGLRLEGLLDERRKDDVVPPALQPMRDTPPSNGIDFSLTGLHADTKGPVGQADEAALGTKLELAQACRDIGDFDGARELLTEVAGSAHPELARRARSLLSQLA